MEAKKGLKKLLLNRVFETVSFILLTIFTGWFIADNWEQTHFAISGIIVHVFAVVALVGSIGQIVLLRQIDY